MKASIVFFMLFGTCAAADFCRQDAQAQNWYYFESLMSLVLKRIE